MLSDVTSAPIYGKMGFGGDEPVPTPTEQFTIQDIKPEEIIFDMSMFTITEGEVDA